MQNILWQECWRVSAPWGVCFTPCGSVFWLEGGQHTAVAHTERQQGRLLQEQVILLSSQEVSILPWCKEMAGAQPRCRGRLEGGQARAVNHTERHWAASFFGSGGLGSQETILFMLPFVTDTMQVGSKGCKQKKPKQAATHINIFSLLLRIFLVAWFQGWQKVHNSSLKY